jgi:hypothetical protein
VTRSPPHRPARNSRVSAAAARGKLCCGADVLAEGDALLRAAQRAGHASKAATIGDLMAAIAALSAVAPPGDEGRPRRPLALLADGVLR